MFSVPFPSRSPSFPQSQLLLRRASRILLPRGLTLAIDERPVSDINSLSLVGLLSALCCQPLTAGARLLQYSWSQAPTAAATAAFRSHPRADQTATPSPVSLTERADDTLADPERQ